MKKALLILVLICLTNSAFSQNENYNVAFNKFEINYNLENYDEIFNQFSTAMQADQPIENTKRFLSDFKNQFGKIIDKKFAGYDLGKRSIYKTQFERGIFGVYILLDNQNKISNLLIEPFKEIESASINALVGYPKNIADIIFSKVKNLPNQSQLSVALIQDGKTEFYGAIRDKDYVKPTENHNKIFEIGSITKVFTSTVLASLVEEGKIQLLDEVNFFYPFNFKNEIKMTFESLANHTSGLAALPDNFGSNNSSNPYKNYGKKEIEEYLSNLLKLKNEPKKNYSYSNLGYGLLGYTIGLSQKTTFEKLLVKKVFKKYRMNNSYTTSKNIEKNLVKGIDSRGNVVSNWDFDVLFGAGGILSNTEDLSKFVINQFNPKNKELALTRNPTFDMNQNLKIGLGWHISNYKKDNNLYFHAGATGGYSSFLIVNLKNKSAVIILSNVSSINSVIEQIGHELLKETEK